jgi:WD40 repeat protein
MQEIEVEAKEHFSQNEIQILIQSEDLLKRLQTLLELLSHEKTTDDDLFIILDKFEDYFKTQLDQVNSDVFLSELVGVINWVNPKIHVLISISEDCVDRLSSYLEQKVTHWQGDYLRLMNDDVSDIGICYEYVEECQKSEEKTKTQDMWDIIPYKIAPKLVEEVLDQVSQTLRKEEASDFDLIGLGAFQTGQIEAPYLQLVMTRLWEQATSNSSHQLDLKILQNLGGTKKIVRKHFDDKINSLSKAEKESAVTIFQELVTPQGSKIAFPIYELLPSLPIDKQRLNLMLEKLAHGYFRILRPIGRSPNQPEEEERFEIFHDVLAPAILNWLRQERYKQKIEEQYQERIAQARQQAELAEQKHLRIFNLKKDLHFQVFYQRKRHQDELAALIARQAFIFNRKDNCKVLNRVDYALREALSSDDFSCILYGHPSPVSTVAVKPNSSLVASGSYDGTIRLWDLSASAKVTVLEGHESTVASISFSPDGQWLVSGSWDTTMRLWNTRQLDGKPRVIQGGEERINSVAFSPDSQTIASGSDDQTIKLWDVNVLDTPCQVLEGHEGYVYAVAFGPDGEKLISGSSDNTMRLWDLKRPKIPPTIFKHPQTVYSVAFSLDGQKLASGCRDSMVRLWQIDRLDSAPQILADHHSEAVLSVAFSLDGQKLASGSFDESIRVWNLQDLHAAPIVLQGHFIDVSSVAFQAGSDGIISGSSDNTVRVWALHQNSASPLVLNGHEDIITAVSFQPTKSDDERLLASGSYDHTVRLWDLNHPDIGAQLLI